MASLAATYPPTRLNFLFVDYRGDAFSGRFAELPHNSGTVTNLDGHLSRRVLASLGAEITRRQRILKDHGADELKTMLEVAPDETPPNLMIIVDEFAEPITEEPQFVDEIVRIARVGRGAGVHLVLATQSPAHRRPVPALAGARQVGDIGIGEVGDEHTW